MTHILAFDGTDQAECRGDDNEPCTADAKRVDCADCLVALDDVGRHP